MTRPLDTCWAVVMPSDQGPQTIPPWIGRTRVDAIAGFMELYERRGGEAG